MSYLNCQIVINPASLPAGYFFDDMIGLLQPKQPGTRVIVREGVPGESVQLTGVRAEPSRLVTITGLLTRQAHVDSLALYTDLVGLRYQIIKHGQNYGYWKILSVGQADELRPIASAAGSWLAGPGVKFRQVLEWIVLSTEAPA